DPNHQKDIVGRVGVKTGPLPRLAVAGGLSALYGTGFHSGALATKPVVGWIDANGDGTFSTNEASGVAGNSASPSRNYSRFAVGADISFSATLLPTLTFLGPTSLYGEFIWANNMDRGILPADPYGALTRDARELSYYAAITQMIGPHLLLGVRYDYDDPDRDRYIRTSGDLAPSNSSFNTWSFMGGVVVPWGRLLVEYDLNRNHLGLTSGGLPGNLADNAVTVRGEVRF
ncbi:MAG TPA: hypothetical protein VF518_07095, partial [Polyangia bacterium]